MLQRAMRAACLLGLSTPHLSQCARRAACLLSSQRTRSAACLLVLQRAMMAACLLGLSTPIFAACQTCRLLAWVKYPPLCRSVPGCRLLAWVRYPIFLSQRARSAACLLGYIPPFHRSVPGVPLAFRQKCIGIINSKNNDEK